jgi:cobalt/nickel transport protein
MRRKLELIVLAIVLIFALQFFYMSSTTNANYEGTDGKAEGVINDITGGTYKPISEPIWKPPSTEIESLLFALPAAIGAGIIGYVLGYYRAKKKCENELAYKGKSKSDGDSQSL